MSFNDKFKRLKFNLMKSCLPKDYKIHTGNISYNFLEAPIITKQKKSNAKDELTSAILEIFQKSRKNYGTRTFKHELEKLGMIASRR